MENKAILVGVDLNKLAYDFQYSMKELENLAAACNVITVGNVTQKLNQINKSHYIGSGKIKELQEIVEETGADTIICDDELSPSQIRNLEAVIPDCEVVDRTTLILEIFAKRAKTRESKLQVEIAQLKYRLPRLIGSRGSLGRQGGGSGLNNRGAGETKLEMDRRKIEEQITKLSRELEHLVSQRKMQRRKREKNEIPIVSLVGYTNAGKSTMMNAVLESYNGEKDKYVFEKNMLFATLETSVRNVTLASNQSFLLTDTVGFINKLPHHLVKAFRSTLEEVAEADLLVHVIDISNPHHLVQCQLTDEILEQIGIEGIPVIYAFNKVDLVEEEYPLADGNNIYISAKNRQGIDALVEQVKQQIFNDYVRCELLIPFTEGQLVSYFNEHANVIEKDFTSEGTKLVVECKKADAEKYQEYITHI